MKAMLYVYLMMQSPVDAQNNIFSRDFVQYSPPPLGAFCMVEERLSPKGLQLDLGLTEKPNLTMKLP